MPNITVRAAAEGMPNYPRNPHRLAFVRKLLMRWSSRVENAPVFQSSVQESFMNQHVSPAFVETAAYASAAAAGVLAISTTAAGAASRLGELEAAFNDELAKWEAMSPEHNSAELRFMDALRKVPRPVKPEMTPAEVEAMRQMTLAEIGSRSTSVADIEYAEARKVYERAESAARRRTGFATIDRAYERQMWRTSDAAKAVMSAEASNIEDLAVKARVYQAWQKGAYEDLDDIMGEILRVARRGAV
ncbi:hypothetical protein [Mesorhizobium sp.]|uniref:hypothetical protein n=1 Tax=Mesorhizobium sp. TaxID=1871066 RepID=UPI000FE94703|nr:hypothetical protein [Mesorhizobium sp.]RWB27529.1 MAG: hypothetical protein EOQ43_26895 [Mesorhizobium sp.]